MSRKTLAGRHVEIIFREFKRVIEIAQKDIPDKSDKTPKRWAV